MTVGPSIRRIRLGLTSLLLAGLWVTWPGADPAASLGAVAIVGAAALALTGNGRMGLVALAIAGAASPGLTATVTDWRPWIAAVLAVVLVDDLLVDPERPRSTTPGAWRRTALTVGGLVLVGLALQAWRPTRYSLVGDEGVMAATLAIGAIAAAIVLWLTAETDPTAEDR